MIPRNLKHVGPYADRANSRAPTNDQATDPLPDDCKGALVDPESCAPYLPWGAPVTPDQLKAMQHELFEVVDELAKLERWSCDAYDLVVGAIERQPISTLRPDLAHFRERLRAVRAEIRARRAASNHARRHA
ncbi:hypothetical protein [Burkholderia gladioli]|uniref:hypothetical protein n=1 Tax=Burkholderia gladioli TaxID=28095 RepID=UPI00163F78E8|nr:hypothetical protein [Burkholderia gladioli]MBJ9674505.1 hypothetical protein [Burkholderia gladioli]MBU9379408.1 hypothetical protein [Burkholderia gladioli]MDN7462629.1 hypothetical protein [Burkholderia gladioli]